MNLSNYLIETATKKSDFARAIKVSPALLHQWIEGIRPVAIPHCVSIERVTAGRVSRKDLRPQDWADIWPELASLMGKCHAISHRSAQMHTPDHPLRQPTSRASVIQCAEDAPPMGRSSPREIPS